MDHKTPHSLHPSCLHRTRPGGSIHYLTHDDILMATDITHRGDGEVWVSPPARVWSHSCIRCELAREGWNGWRASPYPLNHWLGKTLRRGLDDSSDGWMTLKPCKWKCKHPSTHRPAWRMTSLVTSGLTLMLKSWKDLSLGEVPSAQVWVLAYLVPFLAFPVILSLVLLVVPLSLSWLLEWIASSS
jgi:hypothetical protein